MGGASFKKALNQLMEKLNQAQCHFARCIKPNKQKVSNTFDAVMVMDQLRLCGVMETVEIRKAGFLVRQPHMEFAKRYFIIIPKEPRKALLTAAGSKSEKSVSEGTDGKVASEGILKALTDGVLKGVENQAGLSAVGKTKVFIKSNLFRQ